MHAQRQHEGTAKYGVWVMAVALVWTGAATADQPLPAEARPQPLPVDQVEPAAPAQAGEPVAPADAEAIDELDEAELREQFRVSPQSFNLNSHLHFDDDGNVHNEQHNMGMNLNIFYDPQFTPRSYRDFRIDAFVTDAGEELSIQHHMAGEQVIHHHHRHGQQAPRFNVSFQVSRPKQAANQVRRLSGSVDVVMPVGEPRHAVLGPVKEVLGKRVHIANFPGSDLQISREDHGRMRLQMNADLAGLLTTVRFYDAEGQEIPAQQRGTGRHGDQHQHYYQFDVPEDGQVKLTFLSETRVLRVPFELEDIPLPQAQNGAAIDLVIRAEPDDPMVHHAGPGEGDLDVRVE